MDEIQFIVTFSTYYLHKERDTIFLGSVDKKKLAQIPIPQLGNIFCFAMSLTIFFFFKLFCEENVLLMLYTDMVRFLEI